ncbi:hypothetical protein [Elioraea tepida]|uniref:hypothetical protein n=1 Tax=Elioraea tepida TaxID=2843330 RepID=UPI0038B2AF5D
MRWRNGCFPRASFDLIYARPGQSVAAWREELARALAHGLGHLSLYQLTIEPGTPFARAHARGELALPDDATQAALYEATVEERRAPASCPTRCRTTPGRGRRVATTSPTGPMPTMRGSGPAHMAAFRQRTRTLRGDREDPRARGLDGGGGGARAWSARRGAARA